MSTLYWFAILNANTVLIQNLYIFLQGSRVLGWPELKFLLPWPFFLSVRGFCFHQLSPFPTQLISIILGFTVKHIIPTIYPYFLLLINLSPLPLFLSCLCLSILICLNKQTQHFSNLPVPLKYMNRQTQIWEHVLLITEDLTLVYTGETVRVWHELVPNVVNLWCITQQRS